MVGSLRYSGPLEEGKEEEEDDKEDDVNGVTATASPVVADATDDTTNDGTADDATVVGNITDVGDDPGVSSHRRNEFDGAAAPGHSTFVEENDA